MLEYQLYGVDALLLVLVDYYDGLCVVGHGLGLDRRRVGRHLYASEELLYLGFYVVYVDIAHHDDALVVGPVPLFVVGAQRLGLEAVDDAHQPDGHSVAVLAARV